MNIHSMRLWIGSAAALAAVIVTMAVPSLAMADRCSAHCSAGSCKINVPGRKVVCRCKGNGKPVCKAKGPSLAPESIEVPAAADFEGVADRAYGLDLGELGDAA